MKPDELAARRDALRLSQEELAMRFGVHKMTVSKWERGLHRIPEMVGMALSHLEQERRSARPQQPGAGGEGDE